jgi:hypothetical protein
MTYDRRRIRQLTTAPEFEVVGASASEAIRKLSKQALQSHISRARRLRDKQRDLLRRQKLASRARTGTKQGAAARTAQKAQLFEETLARFTKRLHSMKAKGPKPAPRGARKTSGQAALRQKARTPRMKAMQAHVGSRGRRRQARRDSR